MALYTVKSLSAHTTVQELHVTGKCCAELSLLLRHQCAALGERAEAFSMHGGGRSSSPAMRPCTWNSGITSRDLSLSVSSYVTAMLCKLAARLACVSGTPLGLEVVPAFPACSPHCHNV